MFSVLPLHHQQPMRAQLQVTRPTGRLTLACGRVWRLTPAKLKQWNINCKCSAGALFFSSVIWNSWFWDWQKSKVESTRCYCLTWAARFCDVGMLMLLFYRLKADSDSKKTIWMQKKKTMQQQQTKWNKPQIFVLNEGLHHCIAPDAVVRSLTGCSTTWAPVMSCQAGLRSQATEVFLGVFLSESSTQNRRKYI